MGTRECHYTLFVTNTSDKQLILSLHYVIVDPASPNAQPKWLHTVLMPGEKREQSGHYLVYSAGHSQAGEYKTWYTDQIAVTDPACFTKFHVWDIPNNLIEPYAAGVEYFCSP
jgi:hypothetical protein